MKCSIEFVQLITPNCGTVNNRVNYFLLFKSQLFSYGCRVLCPLRVINSISRVNVSVKRLTAFSVWVMQVGTKRVFWRKKEKNIVNRDNNMFAAVLYYADIQRIAMSWGWSKGTNVWVRRLFVVFQVLLFDSATFVFNQVKKDMFIILNTKTSHLVEYMLRSLITIQ